MQTGFKECTCEELGMKDHRKCKTTLALGISTLPQISVMYTLGKYYMDQITVRIYIHTMKTLRETREQSYLCVYTCMHACVCTYVWSLNEMEGEKGV